MLRFLRRWWGYEHETDDALPEDGLLHHHSSFSVRRYTSRRYRELVDGLLKKATPAIGEYLFSCLAEPGTAAASENSALVANWQATWPDMEADLHSKLRKNLGVEDDHELERVRSLRLRHWAVSSPSPWPAGGCPQPFTWLRATVLHLLFPADEEPNSNASTLFVLCNLCVSYQIANWANLLRLALIDRTDEFQLITFVIANRSYHFVVYGLLQLFQNQFNYFSCVMTDVDPGHPCSSTAPGRHPGYELEFAMEMLRMASCLWAFALLRYADGGKAHLYALETRRLGLEPRSRAAAILRAVMLGETAEERAFSRAVSSWRGEHAPGGGAPSSAPLATGPAAGGGLAAGEGSGLGEPGQLGGLGPSRRRKASWTREAQTKSGKAVKGGMLRYFIMYDVGCWLLCYTAGFVNLVVEVYTQDCDSLGGTDHSTCEQFYHGESDNVYFSWSPRLRDWRLWMTLDFSQTTYSLLLVPWLALTLRPVQIYLMRAKATGYDRSGMLCATLTAVEQEQRAEEANDDALAAQRIQAAIRGKNVRRELAAGQASGRQSGGGGGGGGGGSWSRCGGGATAMV